MPSRAAAAVKGLRERRRKDFRGATGSGRREEDVGERRGNKEGNERREEDIGDSEERRKRREEKIEGEK